MAYDPEDVCRSTIESFSDAQELFRYRRTAFFLEWMANHHWADIERKRIYRKMNRTKVSAYDESRRGMRRAYMAQYNEKRAEAKRAYMRERYKKMAVAG